MGLLNDAVVCRMIDPTRLNLDARQHDPADVRTGFAIVHHYFTGTPVDVVRGAFSGQAIEGLADLAGSHAGLVAHYYPDIASQLDPLYETLHERESLLLVHYDAGAGVRCVTAYVSPGGLRCRDATNAAEPVRPLSDLAALGPLLDGLLCLRGDG